MKEKLENYKTYLINTHKSLVYYNYLSPFMTYLEDKKIEFNSLTKEIIAQYFSDKKYASQSINSLIKAGRNYCLFLNIPENPFKTISLLKTERRIPNYLTEKDIQKAIGYILTYNNRLHLSKIEAVISFLFFTGCRKGELLLLHRKDIDLAECSVKIYGEKTKQERMVYFGTKLKNKLDKYFLQEPEETNAFNITQAQLDYMVRLMCKYLPDRKITPHTLRHSFGRNLVEKGVPIGVISKQMGHCLEENTRIVTSVGIFSAKELYNNNIDRLVSGKLDTRNKFLKIKNRLLHEGTLLEIKTEDSNLKCSPNHKLFIWNGEKIEEKLARDLTINDYMLIPKKIKYSSSFSIGVDMARLIGYYLGDGSFDKNSIKLFDKKKEYIDFYYKIVKNIQNFKIRTNIYKYGNTYSLNCYSVELANYFRILNLRKFKKSERITGLLTSLPIDEIAQLIAGLFDAEGYKISSRMEIYNTNLELLKDIQLLLLRFGIRTRIIKKSGITTLPSKKRYNRTIYILTCYGRKQLLKFSKLIPTIYKFKINNGNSYGERIELHKKYLDLINSTLLRTQEMKGYINLKSYNKYQLISMYKYYGSINKYLSNYLKYCVTLMEKVYFSKIKEIKKLEGSHILYDFEVESPHRIITDGFYTHNSSIVTTQIYTEADNDMIKRIMREKMNKRDNNEAVKDKSEEL